MPLADKFEAAKRVGGSDPELEKYMEDDIGAHGDLESKGFGEEAEVMSCEPEFDASKGGHALDDFNQKQRKKIAESILDVSDEEIDELLKDAFKKDKNS
jgi:hypothetical protein